MHTSTVSTLGDKEENFFKNRNTFGMFVICDIDQCYAEYIRWYGRVHGERRTRCAPAPASLLYPDAALPLVRSPQVQAAPLMDVAATIPIMRTWSS